MSSPSPSDSPILIERAVSSLLQQRGTSHDDNDDPFLYLLLDLKTNVDSDPPLSQIIDILTTHPICLPHSILSNPPKLGLIINDITTNDQELIPINVVEQKIQSFNKPINIPRIFKLSELQADQSPASSKKSFFKSFDMLFADKSKSTKRLLDILFRDIIVVCLDLKNNEDWEGQVERACNNSTFLHLSTISTCYFTSSAARTLTCYAGKVGRDSMNVKDIGDNAAAV